MSRTILITGASSGFGQASARLFAESGWQLLLLARRKDRLDQLIDSLRQVGCDQLMHTIASDIREPDQWQSALDQRPAGMQHIDILLNNAGLAAGLSLAHEADLDDWHRMIDTNVTGLVDITRFVLPGMVERNQGHIINMGSVAGNWPYPSGNVYGATKAFVKQFTNNLKADLIGTGVRVSNIEPGLAETEFSQVRFAGDQNKADAVYQGTTPLSAEDIAEIVMWIASRPAHVNINAVEVMPVCQSFDAFRIDRSGSLSDLT